MGTKVKNLLFIVEKIGPYHNSRFNYLSKVKEFKIFVIETNTKSKTYLWEEEKNTNYIIYKLKKNHMGSCHQSRKDMFGNNRTRLIFFRDTNF